MLNFMALPRWGYANKQIGADGSRTAWLTPWAKVYRPSGAGSAFKSVGSSVLRGEGKG